MPSAKLPERASLGYLKKLAKERLRELRSTDPAARLADAQYAVARDHGFSSWRALKAEIDRRRAPTIAAFFRACVIGDVETLRTLLDSDPGLVRERTANGSAGLHQAVGHPAAMRLLLDHGADSNARDAGDNASALHFAAGGGHLESVRLLLDAGADVQGSGDVHQSDVIGWAAREGNEAVVNLLLERGARHHIFSAIAVGDVGLVERLVEENPECLSRRRSRFENRQTPVHMTVAPPDGLGGKPNYEILARLIELGADVEATDDKGRTPLSLAMLRGDREAIRLLKSAGAKEPASMSPVAIEGLAESVKGFAVSLYASDMRATVAWYEAIGFSVASQYEDDGELDYVVMSFGAASVHFSRFGEPVKGASLWLYTDRIDEIYQRLKHLQFQNVQADAVSRDTPVEVRFTQDLYAPFYGGRQFDIEDPNGVSLYFHGR
jgi:ankyrin repeat protein